MKVRWSGRAQRDMRAIRAQRSAVSESSGDTLVKALARRTQQLVKFPESGRMVPEFENPYIRELIEQEFRVIYELFPDSITILAVLPGRMLPD